MGLLQQKTMKQVRTKKVEINFCKVRKKEKEKKNEKGNLKNCKKLKLLKIYLMMNFSKMKNKFIMKFRIFELQKKNYKISAATLINTFFKILRYCILSLKTFFIF